VIKKKIGSGISPKTHEDVFLLQEKFYFVTLSLAKKDKYLFSQAKSVFVLLNASIESWHRLLAVFSKG